MKKILEGVFFFNTFFNYIYMYICLYHIFIPK